MGGFGLKMFLKSFQNRGKFPYIEMAVEFVQDFDESTHVRALEFPRHVDIHVYGGYRVLDPVDLVHHSDRIAYILYANFVYADVPVVGLILNIDHVHRPVPATQQLMSPGHAEPP